MREGRKGHKKNERSSGSSELFFCFAFATVFFCFGPELIRGETEFSLKRQGEENYWIRKGRFCSLRDATTILFGTRSSFKQSTAGLNSRDSFSGSLTKAKEPSLSYYLFIAVKRRDRFVLYFKDMKWTQSQCEKLAALITISLLK